MSKDHAKGAARPSQLESTPTNCSDGAYAVYVASLIGGGILPESGDFTIGVWAKLFGRSEDQVRDLFDAADVEYRRYGGLRFYNAVDVREMSPKIRKSRDPENARHGGRRVKKGT